MTLASSSLLTYLKENVPSDERTVNRLFVSAFIQGNIQEGPNSRFLSSYVIHRLDDDYGLFVKVEKRISSVYGEQISLESLVKLFEYVISPADRIVSGAVYTPENVRMTILRRVLGDKGMAELRRLRIADVSCGCGGFLMDAARWIHQKTRKPYAEIFLENLFGIDIQKYSIERTKILLSLLALSEGEDADFEFNLLCRDTLDFEREAWDERYTGFDIVVGNPPYVCSRKLSKDTHEKLKGYEVCSSGHPDLYIPFFYIAINMLNNRGRLGFITMNTFLRSVNGRAIRKYFSRNQFAISIVDFRGHQIFGSRNTYTCLFYLDKQIVSDGIDYAIDVQGVLANDIRFTFVPYIDLDNEKGWTLNHFEETRAIESIGVQIKDYCPSRHGIATLSNDTYIFKPAAEDERYYYIERSGKLFPIEKAICKDIVNSNKLNSVKELESLLEKVIYPYRVENGQASVYKPTEMRTLFPKALAYLQVRKDILLKRDKGDVSDYPQWYAFGRTQSLVLPRYKLFFPKFANKPLRCVICDAPDLLLYNGVAFVNINERKLRILKSIIESDLFWQYVQANGKPYSAGYYSLSGVDIKHFGMPVFTAAEEDELLSLTDKRIIEQWLKRHYQV